MEKKISQKDHGRRELIKSLTKGATGVSYRNRKDFGSAKEVSINTSFFFI